MCAIAITESPPTRTGNVWEYVSASRLSLWMRCPRAFALRYIEGVRSETTPTLFLGKVVHRVLERYYLSHMLGVIPMGVEHVPRCVDESWHELQQFDSPDFGSREKEHELRVKAENMLLLYVDKQSDEPPPLQVEESLSAPLIDPRTGEDLGIPLVGIIDLLCEEQEGPLIVDFKTAARSTTPSPLAHELQLTAYAYLVRHSLGRQESGVEIRRLIKTKQPRVTTHRYLPRPANTPTAGSLATGSSTNPLCRGAPSAPAFLLDGSCKTSETHPLKREVVTVLACKSHAGGNVLIERWRCAYDTVRPQSALGYAPGPGSDSTMTAT